MSDSVGPHGQQPTRLPRPWDSPGKNTGVGCHFLLQCVKVKSESEVAQSCLTLSDAMGCSPPGSSVHGIFQARVLEWGAIAFSERTWTIHHIDLKMNNDLSGNVLCFPWSVHDFLWLRKRHMLDFLGISPAYIVLNMKRCSLRDQKQIDGIHHSANYI